MRDVLTIVYKQLFMFTLKSFKKKIFFFGLFKASHHISLLLILERRFASLDKFIKIWDPVILSFKEHHRELYEEMVDWYPSGCMEIMVKLRNGKKIIYEMIDDVVRSVHKNSDKCSSEITEEEWRLIFSERLVKRMKNFGYTQSQLSRISGISTVTLSKYMRGQASPSGYNLERLSEALECSVSELTSIYEREY